MKVLLDENLPRNLARHLAGHDCWTVADKEWSGKKNGALLALADSEFDILLTLDKNLPYQQNLNLLPSIPACLAALENIEPGQVVHIDAAPSV